MKQLAPPSAEHASTTAEPARMRPSASAFAPAGEIAQLASFINASPRVQNLGAIAAEINSPVATDTAPIQRMPNRTAQDGNDWLQELHNLRQLHIQNQQAVYNCVTNPVDILNFAQIPTLALPREAILQNTKEYAMQRLVISAMTPTLSTEVRPPENLRRFWPQVPEEATTGDLFFDDNVAFPTTGSNRKAAEGLKKDDPGIIVRTTKETAHADINARTIRVFMDHVLSPEAMKVVLIHEIQHAIDHHEGDFREGVIQDINRNWGDVGNSYRTEFRAYWLGDRSATTSFGSPNNPATNGRKVKGTWWPFLFSQQTHFQNQRQENIFWHMCGSETYPWVYPNYLQVPAFRTLVDGLATPTGGNLINSERIDTLRVSLNLAKTSHFSDLYIGEILNDAGALDLLDRLFLHSNASGPFWTFFDDCFNTPIGDQERQDRVLLVKEQIERIIPRP